jgi:hypothetical protein
MACLRRIYLCCVSLLLASTNVGCEDSCVSDGYRFDASIPEAERRAITAAASEVNAFVGYQAIRIDDSSMCVISDRQIGMHPDGTGLVSGRRKRDLGVWLDLDNIHSNIWILSGGVGDPESGYLRMVQVVAEHEFLHALGLDHVDDDELAVMRSDPQHNARLGEVDRRECVAAGVCR